MDRKKFQPARKYTDAQKMTIIGELLAGETAEAVAMRHKIPTGTCHGWRYDANRNAGEGGRIARMIRDKQCIDLRRPGLEELVTQLVTDECMRARRGNDEDRFRNLTAIFFELFAAKEKVLTLTQCQRDTLRDLLKRVVVQLPIEQEITAGRLSRLAFQLGA